MKHLLLLSWLACAAIQFGAASRLTAMALPGRAFFQRPFPPKIPLPPTNFHCRRLARSERPDDGGTRETDLSMEIAKRITPNFALAFGETFSALSPT